ncbi:MAG TPA: SDR family oxidoreductase [Candidatus Nitrosocosmicus sp.]
MNKKEEMVKKNFKGKVVLITGASSGIGRQTAFDFAKNDAQTIIIVSRTKSNLEELEKDLRKNYTSEIIAYSCDISKKIEVEKMGEYLLEKIEHIDILVNNAGFGIYGKIKDQSIEEIESIMFTNYLGMVYCTKLFLNSMISFGSGHIVNVASVAASFGVPGLAAYCASKFAMLGFSESLQHELHGTGIDITVVSPIGVKTNFFNHESFGNKKRFWNRSKFMLDPKTVSHAILKAATSSRLEIIVPFYMRIIVWIKYTIPYIVNPLVGIMFRRALRPKN